MKKELFLKSEGRPILAWVRQMKETVQCLSLPRNGLEEKEMFVRMEGLEGRGSSAWASCLPGIQEALGSI